MAAKLRSVSKSMPQLIAAALYQETEVEAKEAKRRTPVDTGNLRASIHVIGPKWRNNSRYVYCLIAAGGPAAPYAIYVHENLEAFHKVGQAKYIESVVLEARQHMARRVARRIQLNKAAR
jgi:hypothetical protein